MPSKPDKAATFSGPAAAAAAAPAEPPPARRRRRWRRYLFTLGLWSVVPLTGRLWRSGHRIAAVVTGGVSSLIVLGIIIGIATGSGGGSNVNPAADAAKTTNTTPVEAPAVPATNSKPTISKEQQSALNWIKDHGFDAKRVQANVETVQVVVGLAIKQPTQANIDQLAQTAQSAHDNLDNIRNDFASTDLNGTLGNGELNAFSGANDLKNAMGALVAYTGDPTPATLAHFTSQYQQAIAEWNSGVRVIWRIAHRKRPPTV